MEFGLSLSPGGFPESFLSTPTSEEASFCLGKILWEQWTEKHYFLLRTP